MEGINGTDCDCWLNTWWICWRETGSWGLHHMVLLPKSSSQQLLTNSRVSTFLNFLPDSELFSCWYRPESNKRHSDAKTELLWEVNSACTHSEWAARRPAWRWPGLTMWTEGLPADTTSRRSWFSVFYRTKNLLQSLLLMMNLKYNWGVLWFHFYNEFNFISDHQHILGLNLMCLKFF